MTRVKIIMLLVGDRVSPFWWQHLVKIMINRFLANECKQYFQQMYFEDALVLQTHLNNDWTVLLKNLKQRQDSHLELLQHNRRLLLEQQEEDIEMFMQDKIQQHKRQLSKIQLLCSQMHTQEAQILQKYEGNVTVFQQIVKLTERVGARILETCQYSIDKCKSFDEELVFTHNKMKLALVKEISHKNKVNLEEVIKIVIDYAKAKLGCEIQKLKKLIAGLQNGEFQRLQEIYSPRARKLTLKIQKPKDKSIEIVKVSSVGREEKSPLRQELKKKQKLKKQKQKLATKMVYGLYSTMDLSKPQFIQDMCGTEKQKTSRLYNEIFSRNKFNYEQIIAFEAKKEQFQQKVKTFKEMMEKESKRLSQALIRKPVGQKKLGELSKSLILKTNQLQNGEEEQPEELENDKKNSSNRYRINSPRGKRELKDRDNSFGYSNMLQSTQENFNHFKFDASGQETYLRSNRNRLPQLPNLNSNYRASSFHQRLDPNKNKPKNQNEKGERQELNFDANMAKNEKRRDSKINQEKSNPPRMRMILKNVQVGVQGVMKKVESIGKEKRKIQPNPMQYTFYVRKSGHKFYEPRSNLNF